MSNATAINDFRMYSKPMATHYTTAGVNEYGTHFVFVDRHTPAMQDVVAFTDTALFQAHILAVENIKVEILKEFFKVESRKPLVNPYSLIAKLGGHSPYDGAYYPPLTERKPIGIPDALIFSGKLADELQKITFVHQKLGPGKYASTMVENIPWYVQFHEFGSQRRVTPKMQLFLGGRLGWPAKVGKVIKTPKRDFMVRGWREGHHQYGRAMASVSNKLKTMISRGSPRPPIVVEGGRPQAGLMQFQMLGLVGMAFVAVPPQLLGPFVAWGIWGDVEHAFTGQWTPMLALLYVRSLILGRTGITPKAMRRKGRRRLYR